MTDFIYLTVDQAEDCLYGISDDYTVIQKTVSSDSFFNAGYHNDEVQCEMIIMNNNTHNYYSLKFLVSVNNCRIVDAFGPWSCTYNDIVYVRCPKVIKQEQVVYQYKEE